jgi:hypothetical protein
MRDNGRAVASPMRDNGRAVASPMRDNGRAVASGAALTHRRRGARARAVPRGGFQAWRGAPLVSHALATAARLLRRPDDRREHRRLAIPAERHGECHGTLLLTNRPYSLERPAVLDTSKTRTPPGFARA